MVSRHFYSFFGLGFLTSGMLCFLIFRHFAYSEIDQNALTYRTLEGKNFNLNDVPGDFRLVSYWATWCKPCIEEFDDFEALRAKYHNRLDIVVISDEEASKIRRFRQKHSYSFTYLISDKKLSDAGIDVRPYNLIINSTGTISYSRAGSVSSEALEKIISGL